MKKLPAPWDRASLVAAVPDIARGLRAAFVTLFPFYLATALGRPGLSWMALGGWLGTLADPGGPRSVRARALAAFSPAGAVLVWLGEGVARDAWASTATLGLIAFAMSMMRAAGGAAGSVGTLLTIVAAVAIGRRPGDRVHDAIFFGAGSVLALIVSSIVWPVWTHLPVRGAIATVYAELAAYLEEVDSLARESADDPDVRWSTLVAVHHRRIRASIEAAREMVVDVRARRHGETRFGSNVRALLGEAEAQFPIAAALIVELEAGSHDARMREVERVGRIASAFRQVSRILVAPEVGGPGAAQPRPPAGPIVPPTSALDRLARRLEVSSQDAVELAQDLGRGGAASPSSIASISVPPQPSPAAGAGSARAWLDALSVHSPVAQHAMRAAGAAVAASLAGRLVSSERPYWVTLTTLAILQPYPGATLRRAGERVIGTVFGSALAAVITMTVRAPLALTLLLVPLSVAAVATRPRSYRLFTFFLTPVFVLLADRSHDWHVAGMRTIDAVIGGAIALLAGVVIAPASEKRRLPESLRRMFAAVSDYAAVVLRPGAGEATDDVRRVRTARRAAGIAIGEAETALERFLAEPRVDRDDAADAVLLLTYTRRIATALTSFHALASGASAGATVETAPIHPLTSPLQGAVASYVAAAFAAASSRLSSAVGSPASDPERAGIVAPPPIPPAGSTSPTDEAVRRVVRWAALIASSASRAPGR